MIHTFRKAILTMVTTALLIMSAGAVTSNKAEFCYTDATELTITGKLMLDTANPYHRVDTAKFKGFTETEIIHIQQSAGIAIAFRTNSSAIAVKARYGDIREYNNTNGISARGFDLYVKKDGKWIYAASKVNRSDNLEAPLVMIRNMNDEYKDCLLYLPLYCELEKVEIGILENTDIEAIANPFKHRVGVFGSSFSHGSSTSRSGMSWPSQFSRATGIQMLNLGASGDCKLQPYFADVLCAAGVDALVFDSFSNPTPSMIRERLFPFIEKIRQAHPSIPLIFQQTIYREGRNFNSELDAHETYKMQVADSLMAIACTRYKDVYYIRPNATSAEHDTSIDGTHPGNEGYKLWMESIMEPLQDILKQYGITGNISVNKELNRAYQNLPLGAINPEGWLKEMLERQREGITADLDQTYPEVIGARNGWLGGDGDQWERGPYWIDGMLPLAYILDDKNLKLKAQKWIEWALASQKDDGSFGPDRDFPAEKGLQRNNSLDWWPRMVVLKIMQQYYDATHDERVIDFMSRYFRYQLATLPAKPLGNWTFWAEYRGGDNLASVLWLYGKTGEEWLLELAETIHGQTYDFTGMFLDSELLTSEGSIHCVNLAQGIKEPVVYWQMNHDDRYIEAVNKAFKDIRNFSGYPNGMFGGDEAYRNNDPTNGSELCSAVELMFSLEEMLKITGNLQYADHLERIAFNALPAQITDDFKFHQYFQQANQILISRETRHFDLSYSGTAQCMGFLTGYPCCLCNLHQGWPKFTSNLWYRNKEEGLTALVYAPCHLKTEVKGSNVEIEEKTFYPMDGTIELLFKVDKPVEFPLELRIPAWVSEQVTIKVNGNDIYNAAPGEIAKINRIWKKEDNVTFTLPMNIRTDRWHRNSISVERGPLVYALGIEGKVTETALEDGSRYGKSFLTVEPVSDWNYGLMEDIITSPDAIKVNMDSKKLKGNWYWSPESCPISIEVPASKIEDWRMYNGSTGPMPYSPLFKKGVNRTSVHKSKNIETIKLIPYGSTTLRISEFPILTK